MGDFYCRECAAKKGWINPPTGFDPIGNSYQVAKFIKHTTPTGIYPPNSVFDSSSYLSYSGYLTSALTFGCLEIDDSGRRNIVWFAGERLGQTNFRHSSARPDSAVKVVLPFNSQQVHQFPTAANSIIQGYCAICGRPLVGS